MTATKISPIFIHKLRSSNLQYKNNKNINQLDNYANNNNDIPPKKTTNRQHNIQTKRCGTISNSQTKTKSTQSVSKRTIITKNIVD